jgi:hypothetical protein
MTVLLGGFQQAATTLTAVSGRTYSRQAVQGLWKRRTQSNNGFPSLHNYVINGKEKHYFNLQEVINWYNSKKPEADHRPQALANIKARRNRAAGTVATTSTTDTT